MDFLSDPRLGPNWLNHGGGATMLSYGVTPPRQTDLEGWTRASEAMAAAVPPEHVAFIAEAPLYTWLGDYLFVHAGVRPGVALADQTAGDLMSIRGVFLNAPLPSPGQVVVFGHTPFERPLVEPHKIGIDTGACATGVLTALAIKDGTRRFLQTGTPEGVWPVPEPGEEPTEKPRRL